MLQIQKELVKILMTPSSAELQQVAWMILKGLSSIISDENRQIIYKKLNEQLITSTAAEGECLLALSKAFPVEVHELVLASYMERSFDEPMEAKNIFTTLSALLVVPELRDHIIEVLCLNVFNNKSMAIQLVVLEVLNTILSTSKSPKIAKILFEEWRIVVKLIDLIKNGDPADTQDVMYEASLAVRMLPQDKQMELVEKYLPLMKLNESISDIYVTSGLLGFLEVTVPLEAHFEKLVNELVQLSLISTDETARKLANQLLCSLFNKAPIDDKHRKILRKVFELLKDEVKKHKQRFWDG